MERKAEKTSPASQLSFIIPDLDAFNASQEEDGSFLGKNENTEFSDISQGTDPDISLGMRRFFCKNTIQDQLRKFVLSYKRVLLAVIVVLVACVFAAPIYKVLSLSQRCVKGIDEVGALINTNANTTDRLDQAIKKLEVDNKTIESLTKQLDEANIALASCKERKSCADYSSANNAILICDFNSCEQIKLPGLTQPFQFNLTSTEWFPKECDNIVPEPPKCATERGTFAQLVTRNHQKCPGKLQFQCQCGGQLQRHQQRIDRDCSAQYKICKETGRV